MRGFELFSYRLIQNSPSLLDGVHPARKESVPAGVAAARAGHGRLVRALFGIEFYGERRIGQPPTLDDPYPPTTGTETHNLGKHHNRCSKYDIIVQLGLWLQRQLLKMDTADLTWTALISGGARKNEPPEWLVHNRPTARQTSAH